MTPPSNATAGCQFVGEYVDEGENPANLAVGRAEVVRPQVVAEYVDTGESVGSKEFIVLLKDGRIAMVRGHGLRHEPHPLAGQDVFSVIECSAAEEVVVAVFKGADVAGIFHGELRADRKIA
jgi:hypothetical protein